MADDPKSFDAKSSGTKSSDTVSSSDPVESAIASAAAAGRKRKPPTLDLTATDTTPADTTPTDAAANPPPPDAVIEAAADSPFAGQAITVPPSDAGSADAPSSDAPSSDVSSSDASAADNASPEPFATGEALPPPPPVSPPPSRTSFGGAFAAGALGAVLMLVVLGMLWFAGMFSGDNTMLTERTSRLEMQLRSLGERSAATSTAPAFDAGKLDDVTKRIAALESRPAASAAPDAALAGRIASLESTIKALSGRLDATANTAREAAAQPSVPPAEIEALNARLDTLDRGITSLRDDVTKRFAAGVTDPAARRAMAADALRAAVERGEPFGPQLKAAGNADALAPLRPFADTGVPTAATLARELNALLPNLRAAQPATPDAEAGFMQKLAANAEKLVRVRPVNEVAGDDPAATLSRIEARARSADIDGALAELNKLPAEARAPAADWMRKAQARRDAVQAARQFASSSITQLTP